MQSVLVGLRFVPEKAALFQAIDDYYTAYWGCQGQPSQVDREGRCENYHIAVVGVKKI